MNERIWWRAAVARNRWEAWVMVGSSTGLSYNAAPAPAAGATPGMFHNRYGNGWRGRARTSGIEATAPSAGGGE